MDGTAKLLDIPNLRLGIARMLQTPIYTLYGESHLQQDPDFLHCETIPERSRLHDFRIREHRHEQLSQILFLSAGQAEAVIDGAATVLSPPCLVMVPALTVHGYRFSNHVDGWVLTVYQRQIQAILRASPETAGGLDRPHVVALADQPAAARMIAASLVAVTAELAGRAPGRRTLLGAHLALICVAADRARLATLAGGRPARPTGLGHIARFRDMIEADFHTGRPIEDYAGRLGVTPTHLRRLCRKHLGATPLAVLNARVVLEAKRLLEFSSRGVKEVADLVGFADPAYFSRFFHRETGLAPSAFRARRQTMGSSPLAVLPRRPVGTLPETGRRDA